MDPKNNEENKAFAALFGNNPDISLDERARVITELQKIGSLTFDITKSEDGWMAQCQEVTGIITGGTNPDPTSAEIESQIRDAIYAAFNVQLTQADAKSPYFSYTDLGINSATPFSERE